MQTVKTFTKADDGKLSKLVEYPSGVKIKIPINKDGSVRWYEDKPKRAIKNGRVVLA